MATLTTTTVPAYAHCRDPRCPGSQQEPVEAVRHLTEFSYVDNGGNLPGVERSTDIHVFADETQAPCPHCALDREVTPQKRPSIPPLSGHRQDGLLHVKQFDAGKQPTGNDAVIAQLMAQVAELSARVASGNPGALPAEQLAAAPEPTGFARAARDEGAAIAEAERQADIRERRMAALAKAREAKAAKAKED